MQALLDQIGQCLSAAIGWIAEVVNAMFGTASAGTNAGTLNSLVLFLALGMGVGLLGLGVKYVRSFVKIG